MRPARCSWIAALVLGAGGASSEPDSLPAPAPRAPAHIQRQIDAHERARGDWEGRMFEMRLAYVQTQAFGRRDLPDERKLEAWRRFAEDHAEDNPYSRDDDRMRREARMQIVRLERRVSSGKE